MNQPPQKSRWQFSLKVLLIVITMAGVGMGMMRLGEDFFSDPLMNVDGGGMLIPFGWILLTASPGVLIGYGYIRWFGAIIGGISSVLLIYFWVIACASFGLVIF